MNGIGSHTKPNNGLTNYWLTPRYILDVLGEFDLDPCSCVNPPWPTARVMLTHGGLTEFWWGRVWLNPPYGDEIGDWMGKMTQHNHGIAIAFARRETRSFCSCVWGKASGLLFLHGRLHFCYPDGTPAKGNAGGPSVLIAYGANDCEILRNCGLKGSFVQEVER